MPTARWLVFDTNVYIAAIQAGLFSWNDLLIALCARQVGATLVTQDAQDVELLRRYVRFASTSWLDRPGPVPPSLGHSEQSTRTPSCRDTDQPPPGKLTASASQGVRDRPLSRLEMPGDKNGRLPHYGSPSIEHTGGVGLRPTRPRSLTPHTHRVTKERNRAPPGKEFPAEGRGGGGWASRTRR